MDINEINSQDLFALLDSLDWGISIFDETGRFVWVNRYVLKASGRPRSFFIGQSPRGLNKMGVLNVPVAEEVCQTKKKITRMQSSYSASGVLKHFVVTGTPIFDSEGNVKLVVADRMEYKDLKYRYDAVFQEKENSKLPEKMATNCKRNMIYKSAQMEKVVTEAARAAGVASVILLQGESGTGKDVFAHYVHENSPYQNGPMIEINCASMPEALLESELFGYVKGAFTGASNNGKVGLIEAANKGTLFLDEINSMPLGTQAKLLRVLESRSITRLGATKPIDVDFRLVAATNRNLWECVEDKSFRLDLYYRLNVIPITIPPLRERKEDIPLLVDYFLELFCGRYALHKKFSKNVYSTFMFYDWPGNVRELKNIVERMVIMSTADTVRINEVPSGMLVSKKEKKQLSTEEKAMDEKERIQRALNLHNGHRENTANYLNISRRTLQYKIKKYGLK